MLDLDRAKGTLANAIAPSTGTAIGGLLSGVFVEYLPAPTSLVYLVLLAIVVVQGVGRLWPRRAGDAPAFWHLCAPTSTSRHRQGVRCSMNAAVARAELPAVSCPCIG